MKANTRYEVVKIVKAKPLDLKRIIICRSEEEALVKMRNLKKIDDDVNAEYFQTFNPNIKPYNEEQLKKIYNLFFCKNK